MIRRVLKRMEKVQGKVAAKMISSESGIACLKAKDEKSYNMGVLKSELHSRGENQITVRDSRATKFRKSFLSRKLTEGKLTCWFVFVPIGLTSFSILQVSPPR